MRPLPVTWPERSLSRFPFWLEPTRLLASRLSASVAATKQYFICELGYFAKLGPVSRAAMSFGIARKTIIEKERPSSPWGRANVSVPGRGQTCGPMFEH